MHERRTLWREQQWSKDGSWGLVLYWFVWTGKYWKLLSGELYTMNRESRGWIERNDIPKETIHWLERRAKRAFSVKETVPGPRPYIKRNDTIA